MTVSKVFENCYRDSVLLMKLAGRIRALDGVENAEVMIATKANKGILEFNGLLTDEIAAATPNDLVISIRAEDPELAAAAMERAEAIVFGGLDDAAPTKMGLSAHSVSGAVAMEPDANLAILSIPGGLLKKDALKLLDAGVNLLIFSDNVDIDTELELKQKADEKGLIVMGPDCGTAMINGAALAFANNIRKGRIGMVCASGTGLQEVACILHNFGQGISHAIGTGSHDVSDQIGGISMRQGIRWLQNDPGTDIIVIITKPPGSRTMECIMAELKKCTKPVVVNFLGQAQTERREDGIRFACTLEDSARQAIRLCGGDADLLDQTDGETEARIQREIELQQPGKRVRGLFTGGTLGTESVLIMKAALPGLTSNISVPGVQKVKDPWKSEGDCVIDMGDDVFTLGKPHPMIDPDVKNRRLLEEAALEDVGVLLLDFVLGYGVHEDPVGATVPYIKKARELAEGQGRHITFVASVTGTEGDPQNREKQIRQLKENGVVVCATNAQAARAAVRIATAKGR